MLSESRAPLSRAVRALLEAARHAPDVTFAIFVVLTVAMMILPLPTPLLDVLIAGNIGIGVLVLLVAVYVKDALGFTAFPTLLLVTTLYRLALNVSSTRLILLQGDAGEVIQAFGTFVVRGNYVVGAVVFLILTLVQFIVIAKGAERVAEVGARFTLDAMPGKQMAIDAELRSGALSQEEARARRRVLQRESQLYGAMDGAMKFVKGDAIAGIVITVVNILGGLSIGIGMRDMSAGESFRLYGLLTIGDGLVSQIPALLISTSAGLVVTRVASEREHSSLGRDVADQIFGNSRALWVSAGFLTLLAVIPGLPTVPFLILAAVLAVQARRTRMPASGRGTADARATPLLHDGAETPAPTVLPLTIELGTELYDELASTKGLPALEDELERTRQALYRDLGVPVPLARIDRVEGLAPWGYTVLLYEIPIARGLVRPASRLALSSAEAVSALGIEAEVAEDSPLGTSAWVPNAGADTLAAAGVRALSGHQVIAHATEQAVRDRAHKLLGVQEVQSLLDQLERTHPVLVRNVVPKPVSLSLLTDVLRRLVEEQVSVRPLREILEVLALHAPNEREAPELAEIVRTGLRDHITHRHAHDGSLRALLLDPAIEETVRDAAQRIPGGAFLALAPDLAREIVDAVRRDWEANAEPVVLTQPDVRRFVRKLLEVDLPRAKVLSYHELAPQVRVRPTARVSLTADV